MRIFAAAIAISSFLFTATPGAGGGSRHSASFPAIPHVCTGLTLHLQPGVVRADGSPMPGWTVAKDIPLDPVDAVVPLYPAATLTTQHLAHPIYGWQGSQYVKTAVAEVSVPAAAHPVLSWYKKTFLACGFTTRERYGANPQHPVSIGGFTFLSPTTPSLRVVVSAYKRGDQNSLVLYYAYAVSPPSRPAASYVQGSQKSVRVTYALPKRHAGYRMTLWNRTILADLINVVDSPQTLDVTLHSCVEVNVGYGLLDFTSASGKRTHVVINPRCFTFTVGHTRPVTDDNRAVWSYVGFLVYRHCLQYHCRVVKIPTD